MGSRHPIEASPEEWIACSSFLGRLTGAGLTECWGLGVWALNDALSKRYWQGRTPRQTLECVVLAGAEYIKHASYKLAKIGAQSNGGWAPALILDSWNSWKDRFGEVAELFDDGPGPGPVQWAAWSARDHMSAMEKMTGLMRDRSKERGRGGHEKRRAVYPMVMRRSPVRSVPFRGPSKRCCTS
ncbi:hypothetical protein CONLIGDRAFT_630451 [Coniochaeta ligniaria NRRL 30616]|uniref:Uncharacterized protein n=1 Tax=Coniochaeta ligniaria NRRL 30616 TaxID=1408157 RepID=A0A1J7JAZ4_9PEZI|nr:hypothetical protein CONLIGDRAFT_630451 [Coniochaeta ligniaria NRRL 30616]